jgi:nucleoid-associated protein YgaU
MFGSRLVLTGVVLLALLVGALGAARSSSGAAPETRYIVQPGDTLWTLAAERYGGDLRKGVWRIEERNGLTSPAIRPGEVIVLP